MHTCFHLVTAGHYCPTWRWSFQTILLLLLSSSKFEFRSVDCVRAFCRVEQLRHTMPSADFCTSFPQPLGGGSLKADIQTSPGNALAPPRLCPLHLRPIIPVRYGTLKILAFLSIMNASYAIPVRRASDLPAASFRFHLTMDTLAVQLTIPPDGLVGDLNPQV